MSIVPKKISSPSDLKKLIIDCDGKITVDPYSGEITGMKGEVETVLGSVNGRINFDSQGNVESVEFGGSKSFKLAEIGAQVTVGDDQFITELSAFLGVEAKFINAEVGVSGSIEYTDGSVLFSVTAKGEVVANAFGYAGKVLEGDYTNDWVLNEGDGAVGEGGTVSGTVEPSSDDNTLSSGKVNPDTPDTPDIPDTVAPGEDLTIKPGDTLSEIAAKHEVSTEVLRRHNKIENADDIKADAKLNIPTKEEVADIQAEIAKERVEAKKAQETKTAEDTATTSSENNSDPHDQKDVDSADDPANEDNPTENKDEQNASGEDQDENKPAEENADAPAVDNVITGTIGSIVGSQIGMALGMDGRFEAAAVSAVGQTFGRNIGYADAA